LRRRYFPSPWTTTSSGGEGSGSPLDKWVDASANIPATRSISTTARLALEDVIAVSVDLIEPSRFDCEDYLGELAGYERAVVDVDALLFHRCGSGYRSLRDRMSLLMVSNCASTHAYANSFPASSPGRRLPRNTAARLSRQTLTVSRTPLKLTGVASPRGVRRTASAYAEMKSQNRRGTIRDDAFEIARHEPHWSVAHP